MNKFVETVAEMLWYTSGCEGTPEDYSYPARRALGSLTRHRDDIARSLALVDSQVDPPLSGKYGKYADAVLALFKEAA